MNDLHQPPGEHLPGDLEYRVASLGALFEPRSVAVIGASDDPIRIGGRPLRYLKRQGFRGAVYPVNPRREQVQGLKAYPSIEAIPGPVDVAIIALPAEATVEAVRACAAKGVRVALIFSAGFAETGDAGQARQSEAVAIARAAGMRLLGPNCLGSFNNFDGFYSTFASAFDLQAPVTGPVSVLSQSGACGSHLCYLLRERGIGVGYFATTGNEADVEIGEALLWMLRSPRVKVVALFAETIRDGTSFVAALAEARRLRKTLVVLKVARSSIGASAAASHTGALAGQDAVFDAILRQFGACRARSTDHLVDVLEACALGIYPANRRLGIYTVSGGQGIQAADAAETDGLEVSPLPESGRSKILSLLPFSAPNNPIDVTAQVTNEESLIGRTLEIALAEGGYPAMVCLLSTLPESPRFADPVLASLRALRERFPDRLIVPVFAAPPEVVQRFREAGFAVYRDVDAAVAALASMASLGEWLHASDQAGVVDAEGAAAAVSDLSAFEGLAELPEVMDEQSAKAILARAGIPVPREVLAQDAQAAREAARTLAQPVAIKIVSPDIAHKTEVGGVVLGLSTPEEVERETGAMFARISRACPQARVSGVLVTPMLGGGIETILGVFRDPVFGPVVMFGLGGVLVEVLRDVSFRLAPFNQAEARTMMTELRAFKLLQGVRGAPPRDLDAIARALARLSQFAHVNRERITEIDVNPFLVMPEGEGAVALDALIVARESGVPPFKPQTR